MLNTIYFTLSLLVNTISIPYDHGANILGSRKTPELLIPYLDFLEIDDNKIINTVNQPITTILWSGYDSVTNTLENNKFPLTIGGDHTVAIASVNAINDFCLKQNKSLGVLWCDAHADFNTIETSPSKNLHGMPVAVLCGHTLWSLACGKPLNPSQFGYYGVRDIDSFELFRIQDYNMCFLETNLDIDIWLKKFDYIHVSFDIDCLDPSETQCVNTPVDNGKSIDEMKNLFEKIKLTDKLIGLDIVEYNFDKGNDHSIIVEILDIVKQLF